MTNVIQTAIDATGTEAALAEREAIVKWLRNICLLHTRGSTTELHARRTAEAIERGEHLVAPFNAAAEVDRNMAKTPNILGRLK